MSPYLLVPKHPVYSLLYSPLSFVPGLVSSASSSARVHLHPSGFPPALVICIGQQEPRPPAPPISPFLLPSLSCPCPRRVTFLVQPQYPISSACGPIPRPLLPSSPSQCTGTLVTYPSVCCKVSSLGALLGPSIWSLPYPLFPEVSGPERCCRTC